MTSKVLEKYLSNYKGINDPYLNPFRLIKKKYKVKRVLYPGSWIHITPSLVFPYVVYVDFFAQMESMFNDPELLKYIETHSENVGKPIIRFHKKDYREGIEEENESYDLLISLSSGFVSEYCEPFIRKEGLLFVNNEHYDASVAYANPKFLLMGVFTSYGKLIEDSKEMQEYFLTTKSQPITIEMVRENSRKPPSKAKYKLKKKVPFYLFQKL